MTGLGGRLGLVCLVVGLSGMTLTHTYLSLPSLELSKAPTFAEPGSASAGRGMWGWKEPVTGDQGSSDLALSLHTFPPRLYL